MYNYPVTTGDTVDPRKILDTGKWGYVINSNSADDGLVFIDSKRWATVDGKIQRIIDRYNIRHNYIDMTLANLTQIRAAVSIYYGDTEGYYPTNPATQLVPKYLPKLPPCVTAKNKVEYGFTFYTTMPTDVSQVKDSGKWGYVPSSGFVFIDAKVNNLFLK